MIDSEDDNWKCAARWLIFDCPSEEKKPKTRNTLLFTPLPPPPLRQAVLRSVHARPAPDASFPQFECHRAARWYCYGHGS